MGIKFDSKVVKEFFKETCKLGGNTKEIDTKLERNKLSEYLANNKDNMSIGDIATFNTYLKETTADNKPTQPKDVEVNVVGDNNNTQVAVGNNNEQNINVYYGTKPVEQEKEVPTTPPTSNKKETPAKETVVAEETTTPEKDTTTKTDKPVKKDKPVKTDKPKKDKILGINDSAINIHQRDLEYPDAKRPYAFYVNVMPGQNAEPEIIRIQDQLAAKIARTSHLNKDEIVKKLKAHEFSNEDELQEYLHSDALKGKGGTIEYRKAY